MKKPDLYTLLSLFILAGPLALSFDRKVAFIQYWPGVVSAVLIVGGLFAVWDIYMTRNGHWWFNPRYTGRLRIAHLPPGEVLFFIAVPYACLFIYEVIIAYSGDQLWFAWQSWMSVLAVVFFSGFAWSQRTRVYTCSALLSVAVFFGLQAGLLPALPGTRAFWLFIGISMLAFLIFNGLYTALPTIHYRNQAIWGCRLGSIPIEDFFYNFSFLSLCLLIHLLCRGGLPWLNQ